MPLPVIGLATSGFQLLKRSGALGQLRKKAAVGIEKGFSFLKEKAKGAKFAATEKGFTLTGDGFSAQGGQAAQGAAARAPYMAAGSTNYLPYLVGGALLLMLLKK